MRRAAVAALLVLSACRHEPDMVDPAAPLPAGREMIIQSEDVYSPVLMSRVGGFVNLAAGTRVRIVQDKGGPARRPVGVVVLEGTENGKAGEVRRWSLAPIR